MKYIKYTVSLILVLVLIGAASICAETVERIVAVVGNRVILASELASQVQMYLLSYGENPDIDINELSREVLNQMVNDELILSAARDDTTITASEGEIKSELDAHLASLASRFPTEEDFLAELRREGLSKRDLEKRYYPQIRDQILKQKIINQKLSKISISRQEVEKFYRDNVDSLPELPSRLRMAHILIRFKTSPSTENSVRQLADSARQLALDGTDFELIANRLSAKGHNVVGGRIGMVRRNEVVPEFGRAAFKLQPGTISGLVRSEYGFHIIKSHTRYSDSADVSQILFPLAPSRADTVYAGNVADSLFNEIKNGADFKELAKLNSDDDESRSVGGELQPMPLEQLRPEFAAAIQTIEPGQVAAPVISQSGYHILKLIEQEDSRPLDPNKDFDALRNLTRQQKTTQMVEDWVTDLKQKVYVDIRDLDF